MPPRQGRVERHREVRFGASRRQQREASLGSRSPEPQLRTQFRSGWRVPPRPTTRSALALDGERPVEPGSRRPWRRLLVVVLGRRRCYAQRWSCVSGWLAAHVVVRPAVRPGLRLRRAPGAPETEDEKAPVATPASRHGSSQYRGPCECGTPRPSLGSARQHVSIYCATVAEPGLAAAA
jgi:hypothetical protein